MTEQALREKVRRFFGIDDLRVWTKPEGEEKEEGEEEEEEEQKLILDGYVFS